MEILVKNLYESLAESSAAKILDRNRAKVHLKIEVCGKLVA